MNSAMRVTASSDSGIPGPEGMPHVDHPGQTRKRDVDADGLDAANALRRRNVPDSPAGCCYHAPAQS